jgi:oligosaccharyltransferase complex subunit alpha (ribophorin I)
MRLSLELRHCALVILQLTTGLVNAINSNTSSTKLLSPAFSPPQAFENTNLVRNINLEKSYPRETTNIVIKNVADQPQTEYYFQFPTSLVGQVSGLEASNKKSDVAYHVELAAYETPR